MDVGIPKSFFLGVEANPLISDLYKRMLKMEWNGPGK